MSVEGETRVGAGEATPHVFDRVTRNALARVVGRARERLREDVTDQLRHLGFQADGTVLDLARIEGLTEAERAGGEELRELLAHFVASEGGKDAERRRAAYDRLVREIGFTSFNRLVALRLAEERGLIFPAIRDGLASAGFQTFERVANDALGGRAATFRAFVECLYDELAVDLPSLFDRASPESRIFPGARCLEDVLALLNDPALAHLWTEDETIGWVYQYYNDPDERKRMREASAAPRNSRELAVRNQFFTPRYVVEFLTDNTLGRLWYEMRRGDTRLADACRYLVRRPHEVFLGLGEPVLEASDDDDSLPQEELLRRPVYIPYRPTKDPRDLKILDPACGSGHFLLYAFDLLATMYEEAWQDNLSPPSEATGRALHDDYPELAALKRACPGLILRHNLHGIDIDPRAVQIAGLSLWLRAQRAYQQLGLKGAERLPLERGNLVCAEPMPGERDLLEGYLKEIDERLRPLVRAIWEKMKLAGEAGSLLKIEEEIAQEVEKARKAALADDGQAVQLTFHTFGEQPRQLVLPLVSDEDRAFWRRAEQGLLDALQVYAERGSDGQATRRRLFRNDAASGFAFVDVRSHRYDVVLMNPPFGECNPTVRAYIEERYGTSRFDLAMAFIEDSLTLARSTGLTGAITTRTIFLQPRATGWRRQVLNEGSRLRYVADLGYGVLDTAFVETAAYVLGQSNVERAIWVRAVEEREKSDFLLGVIRSL